MLLYLVLPPPVDPLPKCDKLWRMGEGGVAKIGTSKKSLDRRPGEFDMPREIVTA